MVEWFWQSWDWFGHAVQSEHDVAAGVTAAKLAVAFVFGVGVALLHAGFRAGDANRTNGLGTTIILLTLLVAMVTYVIGTTLARAFGLVGALSIVRFRTQVSDTRDTTFVIFAVTIGMAVGAGYIRAAGVALPTLAVACGLIRLFGRAPHAPGRLKLRLAAATDADALLRPALGKAIVRYEADRSSTSRKDPAVVLTYRVWLAKDADPAAFADALRAKPGVLKVSWSWR
jgi:hypothetical protein